MSIMSPDIVNISPRSRMIRKSLHDEYQHPRSSKSNAHNKQKLMTWAISSFSYNIRAAAASARIPKELAAWLKSAAPVYATDVDDVVLVTAPVPEAVVDFVVFREMDVPVVVTPVDVRLDVVIELLLVVLELLVVDVTLDVVVDGPVEVLELVVVDVALDVVVGPVVVLELVVVELEEVIASVQLLEVKAAAPSANAASKGAANVAARD